MRLDRLSRLFDDPGPFASAYGAMSREPPARAAYDDLVGQGAPDEVAEWVQGRLAASTSRPAPVSRYVVASARGVLLDEVTAVPRARTRTCWDALPDVAEWVQNASTVVPYVLAVVDDTSGRVQTLPDHGSQADQEDWIGNAEEVVAEIRRQLTAGPDLLVLAGDAPSRRLVEDRLDDLRSELIQLEHADEIHEVLAGRLAASRLDRLHELGQQLGRGDRLAVGVAEVADALARGQVDTLYLDPVTSARHELDPAAYPGLAFGAVSVTGPVPADRALLAAACLTDADVITAGTEHLFGTPVAAVLRWGSARFDGLSEHAP